jgi:hypothetical protein
MSLGSVIAGHEQGRRSQQLAVLAELAGEGKGLFQLVLPGSLGLLLGPALGLAKGIGAGGKSTNWSGAVVDLRHPSIAADGAIEILSLSALLPGHSSSLLVLRVRHLRRLASFLASQRLVGSCLGYPACLLSSASVKL